MLRIDWNPFNLFPLILRRNRTQTAYVAIEDMLIPNIHTGRTCVIRFRKTNAMYSVVYIRGARG